MLWSNHNNPKSARDGARRKATGMIKGVLDLLFYYHGTLYAFDVKVGKDKLSNAQLAWIAKIEVQGGKCYEIRSLEQFQEIIIEIIST